MPEILIIADDYTGANDTAVLAAEAGFSAFTVLNRNGTYPEQTDCLSISADSRSMPCETAYETVKQICLSFRTDDTVLFSKRIDSTLRGNLGAETDGILDALGDERTALIVPTYPRAGRIYRDGCLYVSGIPLSKTSVQHDPRNPVTTDSALEILRQQSRYPVGEVKMMTLRKGTEAIRKNLEELRKEGMRLILFEAETEKDLDDIAEAVNADGHPYVCCDPGAFTLAMMKHLQRRKDPQKLLFVIGSVSEITAVQTRKLLGERDTAAVWLDPQAVLNEVLQTDCREYRDRIFSELEQAAASDAGTILLSTAGIFCEKRVNLKEYAERSAVSETELSYILNETLADLSARLLERHRQFGGLFACGGDTALALCAKLEAEGEIPLEEVIPLAVYGKLYGGKADQMPIITKGGMIGDENTLIRCRDFLNRKKEKKQ